MTGADLIAAFEVLADAPDGVKRLRELVLQLAVRGKLVEQDEADEPAETFLRNIRHERKANFRGTRRIAIGNVPCEIPLGWAVASFDDLGAWVGGKTPNKANPRYWNGDIPWISPKDMKRTDLYDSTDHVTPSALNDGLGVVPAGAILVVVRSGILRHTVPVAIARVQCTVNQDLKALCPCPSASPEYLRLMVRGFERFILENLTKVGTTVESMKFDEFAAQNFPLPPLAEQHRIVARVDELMGLLDQLEATRTTRDDLRRATRDAALAALRDAVDTDAVETAWTRIANQMDTLFTAPEDVKPLRDAVSQLAIRGRLVPQSPKDADAAAIVRAAKKERLAESSRWVALPPPINGELPFRTPPGWVWARFDDLCSTVSGVTKGRKLEGRTLASYPYLRVANVQAGFLNLAVVKTIDVPPDELEKYQLKRGDVLLTEGGDWDKLGRSAIWNDEVENCIHQNHVFRARPLVPGITSQWLSMFTNSGDGRTYFQSCSKQTTNLASINMKQLKNCPVPVPPTAEQHRIVAKVDTLMALCDMLETRLTTSRDLHALFAAAAVHHLDV